MGKQGKGRKIMIRKKIKGKITSLYATPTKGGRMASLRLNNDPFTYTAFDALAEEVLLKYSEGELVAIAYEEKRSVLCDSSTIAVGKIRDIKSLRSEKSEALPERFTLCEIFTDEKGITTEHRKEIDRETAKEWWKRGVSHEKHIMRKEGEGKGQDGRYVMHFLKKFHSTFPSD